MVQASADAGHDWGQYNYANMLFDGRGVVQNREQAIIWYGRAADQGHTRAMNLLARCHEEGWGTPPDPALAREWYRRSAEGGYFRAQFNHATVLAVAGKFGEALDWFEKACCGATPESLAAMAEALVRHEDPRLAGPRSPMAGNGLGARGRAKADRFRDDASHPQGVDGRAGCATAARP